MLSFRGYLVFLLFVAGQPLLAACDANEHQNEGFVVLPNRTLEVDGFASAAIRALCTKSPRQRRI